MRPAFWLLLAIPLAAQTVVNGSRSYVGNLSAPNFLSVTDPACGVKGDKTTDDTAALQACINALPDYHALYFPPGIKIKITSTIQIYHRYGFRFTGLTSMFGGPSSSTDAPGIYWYGADGGTMIDIERSQNFVIEGLALFPTPGYGSLAAGQTLGANILINVDQAISGSPITTNGIFDRLSLQGTKVNSSFIGIAFSLNSNQNDEHMTVTNSNISCAYGGTAGQGITAGPNQNLYGHVYQRNSISNCTTGIYSAAYGQFDIEWNQFQSNTTHIYLASPYAHSNISDNDSEHSTQFFLGSAGTAGVTIARNRIESVNPGDGQAAIQFSGGVGAVLLEGNLFGTSSSSTYTPVAGAGGPYGAPALLSRGNRYPNTTQTLAGFQTFGYHAISQFDGNIGLSVALTKGTAEPITPVASFGILNYDYATQRWVASENGAPYKRLLPSVGSTDPTCDANGIGNVWVDTTTSTSAYKVCLSVSGTAQWVTK